MIIFHLNTHKKKQRKKRERKQRRKCIKVSERDGDVGLLVLVVEVGEINSKIFDDVHMGKRSYNGWFGSVSINGFEASNCVSSINVHST